MTRLLVDREQIASSVRAIYRHVSPGQDIWMWALHEQANKGRFKFESVRTDGRRLEPIIDAAAQIAQEAADAPDPVVFCLIPAAFKAGTIAKEQNVSEGLVLYVELDSHPERMRRELERVLGRAALVVASGGEWTDPDTAEVQDKLDLYFRLKRPATGDELMKLEQAERLTAQYVGSDPTDSLVASPTRWPGSYNRKGKPRLVRIVALNEEREIDLDEALAKLKAVTAQEETVTGEAGKPQAEFEKPEQAAEGFRNLLD